MRIWFSKFSKLGFRENVARVFGVWIHQSFVKVSLADPVSFRIFCDGNFEFPYRGPLASQRKPTGFPFKKLFCHASTPRQSFNRVQTSSVKHIISNYCDRNFEFPCRGPLASQWKPTGFPFRKLFCHAPTLRQSFNRVQTSIVQRQWNYSSILG